MLCPLSGGRSSKEKRVFFEFLMWSMTFMISSSG
jgi:hypothetical protein